jgi:hypothetical protein
MAKSIAVDFSFLDWNGRAEPLALGGESPPSMASSSLFWELCRIHEEEGFLQERSGIWLPSLFWSLILEEDGSARPFQSKKEKSTAILLAIILIFVACHLLRFIVQIYEVFSGPLHGSHKLYQHCFKYGKLHVPLLLIICGNINHLLLVVNSSVNMIIYVCLGRRFRDQLRHLATEHLGCGSSCFESCVLAHDLDLSVSQPVRFVWD